MTAPTQGLWAIVLLVLTLLAFGAFSYRALRLYRLLGLGRSDDRTDHGWRRVRDELVIYLGQRKLIKRPYWIRGIGHALIFWGFLIITWGSADLLLRGIVGWKMPFTETAGYAWLLDIFAIAVLASVGIALIRRAFVHPPRMHIVTEGYVILGLIAFLMLTLLVFEGAAVATVRDAPLPTLAHFYPAPIAKRIAAVLPIGAGPATFAGAWWAHVLTILAFAVYLPRTKHLHIVTTLPNVFFRKQTPRGQLSLIKDIESQETFGAATIRDFTWKQHLDGYTCTECGRCRVVCPTALTAKPLDPRIFIADVRDAVYEATPSILAASSGRGDGADGAGRRDLIGGWISEDTIWACTTCGFCTHACPVFIIPAVDKIVEMRRHLVLEKAEFPREMQAAFRGMETNGNPWGMAAASRADWAKDLPVVTMAEAEGKQIEVLFWVGCAGSYEDRAKKVSRALVELLDAAGVSFAILGVEETCNGDSARRMGNEYLFQMLAQQNVETLNGYGVKKIVTNCPHCFNVIKNEYPDFGGKYEVVHGTELVSRLIEDGRLPMTNRINESIVFHDPCYLGRYNGVYDAPRRILESIPGLRLEELPRSRERGLCCGAGGGRMWMEEKLGSRINQTRMREIADAGTGAVGVSCPFCMVMIGNAKEEIGASTVPFDVLELARRAMGTPPQGEPAA